MCGVRECGQGTHHTFLAGFIQREKKRSRHDVVNVQGLVEQKIYVWWREPQNLYVHIERAREQNDLLEFPDWLAVSGVDQSWLWALWLWLVIKRVNSHIIVPQDFCIKKNERRFFVRINEKRKLCAHTVNIRFVLSRRHTQEVPGEMNLPYVVVCVMLSGQLKCDTLGIHHQHEDEAGQNQKIVSTPTHHTDITCLQNIRECIYLTTMHTTTFSRVSSKTHVVQCFEPSWAKAMTKRLFTTVRLGISSPDHLVPFQKNIRSK